MVSLIVATHGTLAQALLDSAEMLVGEQDHVRAFGLCLGDSVDVLRERLDDALSLAETEGEVLVLTDMLSGSPFNAICALSGSHSFQHLTGVNFPILLEILSSRDECGAKELVDHALSIAGNTVVDAKIFFEEVDP